MSIEELVEKYYSKPAGGGKVKKITYQEYCDKVKDDMKILELAMKRAVKTHNYRALEFFANNYNRLEEHYLSLAKEPEGYQYFVSIDKADLRICVPLEEIERLIGKDYNYYG